MKKQKAKLIPLKNFPRKLRDPVKALGYLKNDSPESWEKRGERMAMKLFHEMAKRVPAYKDFLIKKKINPKSIKTMKDFRTVPTINKDNYLRKYPLDQLCWDSNLSKHNKTICTTSGSTGDPFYFPHGKLQDYHYALVAELYLLTNFDISKKSTLYVNAFPMGAWIGGVFTYEAVQLVSDRGEYELSMINPGLHKQEVIKAVTTLGKYFDQIIIGGYGPFVKDILDDGLSQNVNWKKYNLKFVFSAETFSEQFRDYIARLAFLKNASLDTLNHYGTVDLGTMSYETPLSIAIRREADKNNSLKKEMFPSRPNAPTLTQYIPELFYFESINSQLLCSAYSGIPLVRYDLKDTGGIFTFSQIRNKLQIIDSSIGHLANKSSIQNTVWKLPFVFVHERSDFSVSFYAFQVYPATIRRALYNSNISKFVTGKMSMQVIYSKNMNQKLIINVEMHSGVKSTPRLKKLIGDSIQASLINESSEFRETFLQKGKSVSPVVKLFDYEDSKFFTPGIKQKWVTN